MAVHSQYLAKLSQKDRESLIKELWEQQNHKCFVSGKEIDLNLHKVCGILKISKKKFKTKEMKLATLKMF